jgi:hypothetical protein
VLPYSYGDGDSTIATLPVSFRRAVRLLVAVVVLCAGMSLVVWLLGWRNPYTPAGYVGYLTKGAVFGQSRFYAVQRGQTSPGRSCSRRVGAAVILSANHLG